MTPALPTTVRSLIDKEDILAYSMIDLDASLKVCQMWLIVTNRGIHLIDNNTVKTRIDLNQIRHIQEICSLSCKTFHFYYEAMNANSFGTLSVHFSGQQNQYMSRVKKLIETFLSDGSLPSSEAHETFRKHISAEENEELRSNNKVLLRLLRYLWIYRGDLLIAFAAAFLAALNALVPTFMTGYLIDYVIKPFQMGGQFGQSPILMAWLFVGLIVTSKLLGELLSWVRFRKMSLLAEMVTRDLREAVFSHVQKIDLPYFKKKSSGHIISYLTNDAGQVWEFLGIGLINIAISIFSILALSIVVLFMDWRLGLIVVTPTPLLIYLVYRHGKTLRRLFLKSSKEWSNLVMRVSDSINGIQVVKAFGRQTFEISKFRRINTSLFHSNSQIHKEWTRFWPLVAIPLHIVTLAVWSFAIPRLFMAPSHPLHLTVGTFVSMLMFLGMFSEPIIILGNASAPLNKAMSSAYRVFQILDTQPYIPPVESQSPAEDLKGMIEFKHVTFSYDGVTDVIKNLNFIIQPGEVIGIVGESGSGKTTIAQLAIGLVWASSGEVLIDGKNIQNIDLSSFRRQVSVVLQDSFLFHDTIFNNIRYGVDSEVRIEDVVRAAKAANAHDFIIRLRHGYDTVIGNRGETLSGGERQRIAIARTLLMDPKFLVLDEATSSIDSKTEEKVQNALETLFQGRTVVVIAHRLSTLKRADRLIVLENGQIKESGTHSELVSLENGRYKKYLEIQNKQHEH